MKTYTIEIDCPSDDSLWPDLAAFNGKAYKRRDSAFLGLRKAIYELMQSRALLDRSIAHEAIAWAETMEAHERLHPFRKGVFVRSEFLGFVFTIERTA